MIAGLACVGACSSSQSSEEDDDGAGAGGAPGDGGFGGESPSAGDGGATSGSSGGANSSTGGRDTSSGSSDSGTGGAGNQSGGTDSGGSNSGGSNSGGSSSGGSNSGGSNSGGSNSGGGGTGGSMGSGGSTSTLSFSVLSAGLLDGNSTDWEQARDVAMDELGNIYVVGGTSSPDFPTTPGAYDRTYNTGGSELGGRGQTDGFITKLDPTGAIIWSTYLGSPNYDRIYAIEVDAAHNVYVAGRAGRGFPTTAGVIQTAFAGDSNASSSYGSQDGFVAKLSADGSTLLWSTYFGESGQGFVRDIDIDATGRVHVAASSFSGADALSKVTGDAAQATLNGTCDSFYARLSSDATSIEYGTFLGGNDAGCYSSNAAVRALADGTAFFLAGEPGASAPTTVGAYQQNIGGGDDFIVARFDPDGTMAFCTYLGGSADESLDTHSLIIGADGNPVIAAATASTDYPVTDSSQHQGGRDVAVSILSADGADLLHSTMIGGSSGDGGEGVGVDAAGNIYITGFTNSPNLPVTAGALYSTHAASLEGFLIVFSPDLAAARYVSYDGITAEYGNRSSIVSPEGEWAVVGAVWQLSPFPATAGNDSAINGQHGAFFRVLAAP